MERFRVRLSYSYTDRFRIRLSLSRLHVDWNSALVIPIEAVRNSVFVIPTRCVSEPDFSYSDYTLIGIRLSVLLHEAFQMSVFSYSYAMGFGMRFSLFLHGAFRTSVFIILITQTICMASSWNVLPVTCSRIAFCTRNSVFVNPT